MANVRSGSVLPVLDDLRSKDGTPLYVNRSTGRGYVLSATDAILPLGSGGIYLEDYNSLQDAINASPNGNIIHLPAGVIEFESLVIPANVPFILIGQGLPQQATTGPTGTELRSTIRDGATSAIEVLAGTADFALFALENLYLSGGTYTEVTGNASQGGTPLGNYVGLDINARLRWRLTSVRIAGFDTTGLRLTAAYYGAAYSSQFMWNGVGVDNTDGGNVIGFYNCHFQYNRFGSKNVKNTVGCAWEGNWQSGAVSDILGNELEFYASHFEANNSGDVAGEADIFIDQTNYAASVSLSDVRFASGADYSAKPVATYNLTGKATRILASGSLRIFNASPQNYPLFNLVDGTILYDYSGQSKNFTNYVAFTANQGSYYDLANGYLDVALTSATLTTFYYRTIRLTAASPTNLDTIQDGGVGAMLTILFGDANTTVRNAIGNILLNGAANINPTANSTLSFVYDPNGGFWKEAGRSIY